MFIHCIISKNEDRQALRNEVKIMYKKIFYRPISILLFRDDLWCNVELECSALRVSIDKNRKLLSDSKRTTLTPRVFPGKRAFKAGVDVRYICPRCPICILKQTIMNFQIEPCSYG